VADFNFTNIEIPFKTAQIFSRILKIYISVKLQIILSLLLIEERKILNHFYVYYFFIQKLRKLVHVNQVKNKVLSEPKIQGF
jgi:hypothetical protein